MSWVTDEGLTRVLQSLLTAELAHLRRPLTASLAGAPGLPWPPSLALGEAPQPALGCDSIDRLWLAASVNEMFCLYDTHTETSLTDASTFGDWQATLERGWNTAGRRITFSTSGSTGIPKRCTHELSSLAREIAFWAAHFAGIRRIVALVPPHHIYGFLFTAMLPAHMGIPVLNADSAAPGDLQAQLTRGDLLVSFPEKWNWLARSLPHLPAGVHGLTSTAPCPEPLKSTLMENGLASLTEIYGSSETAGIGWRTYPAPRYTLLPFWSWVDPNANEPQLKDTASQRLVALQDALDIGPDSTFGVISRRDAAVQVGGVNVFPGRLEEQLRAFPGVAEASVRLSTGAGPQRLKAFIVPSGTVPESTLADALQHWTARFPASERIRSFTFGTSLPGTTLGKRADWDER